MVRILGCQPRGQGSIPCARVRYSTVVVYLTFTQETGVQFPVSENIVIKNYKNSLYDVVEA